MGDVSAAGAIEDFVSIGDHGGKAVLGLVYMEIQDFARFTGTIGIFAVDIAYVILVDQAFAIGMDEGGNAYILRLKIEDHLGRPGLAILTAHLEKGASLLMVIVIGISANFHLISYPLWQIRTHVPGDAAWVLTGKDIPRSMVSSMEKAKSVSDRLNDFRSIFCY